MDRGDVVRVDLPQPSGKPGSEQFGERPAVIFQVNEATANLSTVILVPFTKNRQALRFFGSVLVKATTSNGLDYDSVALVHQLRTIDKRRVRRVAGQLSADDLKSIETKVREILQL
jgi:mRNA interferase MazF